MVVVDVFVVGVVAVGVVEAVVMVNVVVAGVVCAVVVDDDGAHRRPQRKGKAKRCLGRELPSVQWAELHVPPS